MHLDPQTLDLVALGGLLAGGLALVVGLAAGLRIGQLRAEVAALRADPALASGVDPRAVRNVSVVRYDAFADMGGRMSYSVALLDSAGDGLVLSAINGRTETRAYAKGILAGAGEAQLSPEEQQAVDAALGRPARVARGARGARGAGVAGVAGVDRVDRVARVGRVARTPSRSRR